MSQTNDIPPPLPVLMPREQQAFTVREMEVGEIRRIPRYAIKLNAEGRCFIFTDRQVTPLAADHEPNGVTIERLAEGYHITIPADEVWHLGSLEDMQREGDHVDDAEPVMSLAVRPVARPAPAELAELASTVDTTSFIRLGYETTIEIDEIASYRTLTPKEDCVDFTNARPGIDLSGAVTMVVSRLGFAYASRLTMAQLDNRLRKAGHTIL